jgi:hypothetical protein
LNLSCNRIGDAGVEALARSPLADTLLCLDVSSNRLSEDAEGLLRSRFGQRVIL